MAAVDVFEIDLVRDTLDAVLGFLIETGLDDELIEQILLTRLEYARRGEQPHLRVVT